MIKESNEDLNKRIDNGLKKKKLADKYGAHFSSDSQLPPEIESEWLNSVEAFEEQYETAGNTTVFEKIGSPGFRKAENLNPGEISVELARLLSIMQKGDACFKLQPSKYGGWSIYSIDLPGLKV